MFATSIIIEIESITWRIILEREVLFARLLCSFLQRRSESPEQAPQLPPTVGNGFHTRQAFRKTHFCFSCNNQKNSKKKKKTNQSWQMGSDYFLGLLLGQWNGWGEIRGKKYKKKDRKKSTFEKVWGIWEMLDFAKAYKSLCVFQRSCAGIQLQASTVTYFFPEPKKKQKKKVTLGC